MASFDFPESVLVAEMYAQALEDEGIAVRRELGLGPRELVMPALRQGLVEVVPEYLGSALTSLAPDSRLDWSDVAAVGARLAATVAPLGLAVLRPAPAQNQNGLVVTRSTAEHLGLEATSDVAVHAGMLDLGGPPECPRRPACLLGLRATYGLDFRAFVPLAGGALVRRALEDGVIDAGMMFTTDGILASDEFVLLADDRRLQPAENLVPLVQAGAVDGRARAALDEVSAALTTANLRFLNWRVAVAGNDPAAEARGWLVRRGLISR